MCASAGRPPAFRKRVPEGDSRERRVCDDCGFVDYENPRIVVGTVATDPGGRYLLCRRAIEPRRGFWTIPAGFLEERESLEHGALREALEEACATLEIDALLGVYSIPRISQVQIMFRARLTEGGTFAAGDESLEVGLFRWAEIPWDDLAFPTVEWALRDHHAVDGLEGFAPFRRSAESSD